MGKEGNYISATTCVKGRHGRWVDGEPSEGGGSVCLLAVVVTC